MHEIGFFFLCYCSNLGIFSKKLRNLPHVNESIQWHFIYKAPVYNKNVTMWIQGVDLFLESKESW